MGLNKQVQLGNITFVVNKDGVYINNEPFQHGDIMELIDWLYDEVQPYIAPAQISTEAFIQAKQQLLSTKTPDVVYAQKPLRDEDLHPEKYAKLPSAEEMAKRSRDASTRAAQAAELKADAFKGGSLPDSSRDGKQRIVGAEVVDLGRLKATIDAVNRAP